MQTKTLLGAVAALGLAVSGVAFAEDQPEFDQVDQNGDGEISEAEASEATTIDFASADTDQSGSSDRSEYEAATS